MTDVAHPLAVTVTLNPAIDLTVTLDRFVVGTVQRARAALSNVGGKGINVAGCLADWGVPVVATGILGRANDDGFAEFFTAKGIGDRFVRTAGETRTNIKIANLSNGETTDINLPGLDISEGTFDAVRAALLRSVVPGRPVVLAGSVPESLPDDAWTVIAEGLVEHGARVVVDTSGAPLARLLSSGLPIHAVKPNRHELESAVGRSLSRREDIVEAARMLIARGIGLVVVSLGEEGALFVTADRMLAAKLPPKTVVSTVGAGDSMVAGLVAGLVEGADLERVARLAVAFPASKLDRIGPHLGPKADVEKLADAVEVTSPVA
jgi:1-phosphofructokinase